MRITQENELNHKVNVQICQKAAGIRLLSLAIVSLVAGTVSIWAQTPVQLPQLVLEVKHTENVPTQNPDTPDIINVKSSNPSVATASVYRVSQVQIVAVAPGKTTVEFFDNAQRVLYRILVWVTAPNPTGGGGQGYNPRLTQLAQIVMLVKHTQNVTVPGPGTPKISGVKSSNPSVATARTNTATTIQIYSVALGDTFIEFTNNTTGVTYQVHVWVQKILGPPRGGGSGGGSASGTTTRRADPTKSTGPGAPGGGPRGGPAGGGPGRGGPGKPGKMDPCLVGTWRSESIVNTIAGYRGGSGIVMTIKGDGSIRIDYDQMESLEAEKGDVHSQVRNVWRGTATGHITTSNGIATIISVDTSEVIREYTDAQGRKTTNPIGSLGPAAPGSNPSDNSYKCDETTLTRKNPSQTFTFKREKKEPK